MFLAEVTFWGPDNDGRINPPESGFHPQLHVDDILTSCLIESTDKDLKYFRFNIPYEVILSPMLLDVCKRKLTEGSEVIIFEGNKKIGEGKILLIS